MSTLKLQIKRLLRQLGYRTQRVKRPNAFEPLLYTLLKNKKHLTFVQIGANDGITADPLYEFVFLNRHQVTGLLIEPVKDYYDALQKNYAFTDQVRSLNIAIHNSQREMSIYRVDPEKAPSLPKFTKGIASFDPKHHEKSGTPADVMIEEKVQCKRLDEVLSEYDVEHLDVLQIDTEGYDAEIILGLDLGQNKPSIIRFEHDLVAGTMDENRFNEVRKLLSDHGYEFLIEKHDATAYQRVLFLD